MENAKLSGNHVVLNVFSATGIVNCFIVISYLVVPHEAIPDIIDICYYNAKESKTYTINDDGSLQLRQ